jgi:hypothetical protein
MRKPLSLQLALLALWTQFWYFLIRFCVGLIVLPLLCAFIYFGVTFLLPYLPQ